VRQVLSASDAASPGNNECRVHFPYVVLNKIRMMDNVQKVNIFINIPSS
jgi:hypothetical protein